ncbi:WD40 repeat-containing protein [Heterostelium album PN500]|uniref:WD40 repeat-containing protein n=1 Tax=Heterostelium pallidum (strain ATCC 26659 / Pp 5 / PN500) TaxID=670386 RepID=D3AW54_HETP5|nr:WD40 repeat-containing protein [Heterostelium album PN500]EFA86527.1 WD40 repeat-containing protein [Heterostelium album PN500]|eukprot:XP_020438632.1 WD40 repeat-containing protein [Heterostelium album PN500]
MSSPVVSSTPVTASSPVQQSPSSPTTPPQQTTTLITSPPIVSTYTTSQLTTIYIEEILGKNLNEKDMFIKFKVDGKKFKTRTQKKTMNPLWNDKFTISTTSSIDEIIFTIHSQNILGNNVRIGTVKQSLHPSNSTSGSGNSGNNNGVGNFRHSVNVSADSPNLQSVSLNSSSGNNNSSMNNVGANGGGGGGHTSATESSSSSTATTVLVDSWVVDQWSPVEKRATTFSSTNLVGGSSHHSNNNGQNSVELKIRMLVKVRDITLLNNDDTSSTKSDDSSSTGMTSSSSSQNIHQLTQQQQQPSATTNQQQQQSNQQQQQQQQQQIQNQQQVPNGRQQRGDSSMRDGGSVSGAKEMSIIGKGGSQIRKFTKKITSKIDSNKTENSGKKVKDERVAAIEEQLARERAKELEREAIEREKERAREKLRQREEEEQQKQLEKERQEERRKAKEAKQKKDKEKRYQPTRPIDYFYVVGCSSKLEPLDQRYESSVKSIDPLDLTYKGELLDCYPQKDDEVLPNHIWMYCFPKGVQLVTEEQAPSFFPFVLTNETGVRFYASCLMFYEPMSDDMASEIKKRRNSMSSMSLPLPNFNVNNNGGVSSSSNSNNGADNESNAVVGDDNKDINGVVQHSGIIDSKILLHHTTSVHNLPIVTPINSNNNSNSNSGAGGANGVNNSNSNSSNSDNNINNSNSNSSNQLVSSTIYVPKCICFISHYPFYSFFRICLNEIYQKVFFSTTPQPIERCIYNMIQEVPLPTLGVNNVNYTINNNTITLKRLPECLLPVSDLPYSLLFKCLDIKNVLLLFKCILMEEKIVIISSQYSLLTSISEILSSLLHPFTWPHVYVPILPELLLEYVYSPFPFIMGIHKSYSHNILNEENLMSEIVVADLDNNIVMLPDGQDPSRAATLPEREAAQLVHQLRKVVHYELLSSDLPNFSLNTMSPIDPSFSGDHPYNYTNGINHNNSNSNNLTSSTLNTNSGSSSSSNSNSSNNKRILSNHYHPVYHSVSAPPSQTTINEHIRLAFIQFFCSVLSDYRRHLKYLRVFPKPITLFNKQEFIRCRSNGSASDKFYSTLVETQAFSYFLDQHNWPKKNLFDYLVETQKYKKSIEELAQLCQSSIPQALGVLELNKYSTVHATPLSTIRNTITTSIKEHSRFPALKQELMVTPPTPSHHRTPSSVVTSPTLVSTATPVSLDIYCSSIAFGDLNSHQRVDDKENNLLKMAEEQHKSFVTIIELFINKMSSDVLPEQSDIQQVLELLKFDTGRQILGKLLLKPYKNQEKLENSMHKARLSDNMFYCLGDILRAALREANMHSDFASTRLYLEASFIYHRLQKGTNEHISELLRNQDIWQNYKFWEQFFFDLIEQRCKALYGNIVREMLKWSGYPEDQQEKMKLEEREMAFSLLSKQVYYMINLGSQPDLVRRFVNKMCTVINFDSDRTETMMQVVSNITRARDMSDMDDLESSHANVAVEGNKHADKELKLYLTKETYLPIGVKSSNAHEGRELLNHLIDEKSNSVVALRSLSRIMNLKSAWSETRSKTSSKIDYRDISENRGDYVVKTFAGHQEGVLCLTLATNHHRESNTLVTGSADSTLKVWDIVSTKCLGTLDGHGGWVNSVEMGSDSKIISGSYDKTLKLWDLNKCTKIKSFRGHKGSISCIKNIDSHQILSGSYDNTLCVWDDRTTKPSSTLVGHQQPIMSIICDGYKIISGSRDTNIRIWDLRTMSTTKILSGHTDWVKCLQYDSDTLLSGSCDGKVKVWSVESGECIRTLQGHSGSVNSLLLHHKKEDGHKKFITASADSTIQVWDSNYAESYHTLSGHSDEVVLVDHFINNIVVSGSFDGTIKLWDVDTGKSHRTIHNHGHRISSLKTYESTIISGSWDKTAKACLFNLDFRS